MFDMPTDTNVERLPIVASQCDKELVLNVPKLPNKSGIAVATAVHNTLHEYSLLNEIEVVCTDTEAANTGKRNGAVVLLEKKLERDLLYFACRHHVYELPLKAVFNAKCSDSKTKSPNVELFNRLKNSWNDIDTEQLNCGLEDENVAQHISFEFAQEMIQFCLHNLEKTQCRADYREFLELTIMFLGGNIPSGKKLKKPGAIHHARWMAKAIGALKIFLIRDQFQFEENEYVGVRDVCIFVVRLYVKAWFQTTSAIKAPSLDLGFIKDTIDYANVDNEISNIVLSKLTGHLWYLSDEAVGLAFFDDEVTLDEKRRMVSALAEKKKPQKVLQASLQDLKSYKTREIHDFISINTKKFFGRFGISTDFLSIDPSLWIDNEDYKSGLKVCQEVRVVNDIAERAVKLFSQYNSILSNKEEQKQFIIKAVQHYKANYPSINKSELL